MSKTSELHTSSEHAVNVTAQVRQITQNPNECALCGRMDWLHVIVDGWGECWYARVDADARGVYEVMEGQCVVGVCNRCYHDGCWSESIVPDTVNLGKALASRMKQGHASGVWFEA